MHYFVRRLLSTALTLVGVSILIFVMVRLLPGNIVTIITGTEGQLNAAQRQDLLREFGLNRPLPVQYVLWIWNMLHGNFGYSFRSGQSVAGLLFSRLPLTLELAVLSVLVSSIFGMVFGMVASVSRRAPVKLATQVFGLLGLSLPDFWIGVLLILFASYAFHWLPPLTFAQLWQDPLANLQQMILPVLALSVGLGAVTLRMTRSSMLEVLGEEFVKVGRAKGLSERAVTLRYALRNALIPIVTILGLQMGVLLGGVVIDEQVFGLPGLGWTLLNGVYQRDYPVVQGAVMLFAVTFILVNLIVDLAYVYLDPRIRYA
ncbi:MAG TPA: ABC transporter permease [Thermomicrobiaceae bacterium]|nr:ABC transporter permease [Thermomicrobiaceae bacterium]